ncbi:protein translocase subunit SecD [Actinomyces bowdenii]|uniref:Protein translocase subunit SecD n=1 Tax=Actinomyces bowdenii TaxID=131109 RepID=A0A3P1URQ6_9ACTO|nr:protein translocase subunit SecD [Actinomyces bowdenii]MBO3725335.1 protein translocase subunit SecD [Actinomyces bowdenii]RRD24147.1 protein translocase subunit SecD [Actinomyces bowdenii]
MLLLTMAIGLGVLVAGTVTHRTSMVPGLALDLEGGTQIILTPTTTDGSAITDEDMDQAIDVIRQRVDASGVAEAQISRQGGQNIVVSLPGRPSEATLELIRTSAVMYFRPVLRIVDPASALQQPQAAPQGDPQIDPGQGSAPEEPEESAAPADPELSDPGSGASADPAVLQPEDARRAVNVATADPQEPDEGQAEEPEADPEQPAATPEEGGSTVPAEPTAPGQEAPTGAAREQIATQAADVNGDGTISSEPLPATSQDNSSDQWLTEQLIYDAYMTDCTDPANLTGQSQDPSAAVISCPREGGPGAYILGPADISGTELSNAVSGLETTAQGGTTNRWVVNLEFDSAGAKKFADLSGRLIAFRDQSTAQALSGSPGDAAAKAQFAIVLDGLTIMASGFNPEVTSAITDGRVQINGQFDQASANTLANQLSFGSLPLNFTVQSEQQISATLGTEQLRNGLIAGLIGFILIIVYLLWQYRGLAVVAVTSLIVAAALTYLTIALLSWAMGYRLSLAGVAGLIVAIGITVDSFIIYFERIRDEVRHGRSLRAAIDEGWTHARRTIIVSDIVNIVAAVVLYFLAVGGVQGFAFTLGVTTVVDLAVVVLFTHPFMEWLQRFRFYSEGHRLSGMDPERLGATGSTYGRAREALAEGLTSSLARRKAAERRAARDGGDLASSTPSGKDGEAG